MARLNYSQLQASFPDNANGLITPQDMRNLVDSIAVEAGHLVVSGGTLPLSTLVWTTVPMPVVRTEAPGITVNTINSTITVSEAGFYDIGSNVTGTASVGHELDFAIVKNGTPMRVAATSASANGDFVNVSIFTRLELQPNDIISVQLRADKEVTLTDLLGGLLVRTEPLVKG